MTVQICPGLLFPSNSEDVKLSELSASFINEVELSNILKRELDCFCYFLHEIK